MEKLKSKFTGFRKRKEVSTSANPVSLPLNRTSNTKLPTSDNPNLSTATWAPGTSIHKTVAVDSTPPSPPVPTEQENEYKNNESGNSEKDIGPEGAAKTSATSPDSRDLWQEAFEKLPEATQKRLKLEDSGPKSQRQYVDELLVISKTKQEECEQKFWKFRVGDREIIIRDYAVKIVGCLQKIGDIGIQFAPPQAAPAWSAIKIVLQIPAIESAQMCALLASTEKILRVVNRCQVYELIYTKERTPELALKNLQSVLLELYTASLELLADSSTLLTNNAAAQTMHAILNPGKTASRYSELAELENKLSLEVQACESGRNADADARLTSLLSDLDAPLTRIDSKVLDLLERVDWTERKEMLDWISAVPYQVHHDEVRELRTSGTCDWLLQHHGFREWEDSSSSVLLWLQGYPGTGKTLLTSKVIDHIQDVLKNSPNNEGFAFFYCRRDERELREPLSVLQSYVRQLSSTINSGEDVRTQIRELYREMKPNGANIRPDMCKAQLLASVNLYPKTTLVLDALDEIDPKSRLRLIEDIETLLLESKRPIKVLISSRPEVDIRERLLSYHNIEIHAMDNEADITKFVNTEIKKHRRWGKMSYSLREDIVKTLLDRSKGMFLWANLQIEQLLKSQMEADIRKKLGKLPNGLKEAYSKIYSQISEEEHAKIVVDYACKWVMAAYSPPSSAELINAICVDTDSETFLWEDKVDEELLLGLCKNLLVLDSQRKVWRFAHLSVAEYFEEDHWSRQQAHCHVAKVNLALLLEIYKDPIEQDEKTGDSLSCQPQELEYHDLMQLNHPLQRYVRHNWLTHAQKGQVDDSSFVQLLKAFLGSPGESSLAYQRWHGQVSSEPSDKWPPASDFHKVDVEDLAPKHFAIFAMCRFSLYHSLRDWWESAEFDHSIQNQTGGNLLLLAALARCRPICENLVKRGVPVNVPLEQCRKYGSALEAAAFSNNVEVVEYLIKGAGADVNMQIRGEYGNALIRASYAGCTDVVKFLVETGGADVNLILRTGRYGSALAAASFMGNSDIVRYLVQKAGADVNSPLEGDELFWDYGSALAAAAGSGLTEIVQFLVQEGGANVNMPLQSENYGSALAAAASYGQLEVVKFLVQEGADINMELDACFRGALDGAMFMGMTDVVGFLVQRGGDLTGGLTIALAMGRTGLVENLVQEEGIDVNMQLGGRHGSFLAAAVGMGELELAKFIVRDGGADVNMLLQNGNFGSALGVAVSARQDEAVKFLIHEGGADVNMALPGTFGCALAVAVMGGNINMAQILIQEGKADVDMPLKTEFGSTLAAAACAGQNEAVRFLIHEGQANVNLRLNGPLGSALAAAGFMGNIDTVKTLIQEGKADINMKFETDFGSALATASFAGETEIVKFMVEEGADVNMQLNGDYGSALVAASFSGKIETVRFLVKDGRADVDMQVSGDYGNAIVAAGFSGHIEVIRFLVQEGNADINMQVGGYYGTVLTAGAVSGHTEVVKFAILEGKADPNTPLHHGYFGYAFEAAAVDGHTELLKFLIQVGDTDVNLLSQNGQFGSALAAASNGGHIETVRFLVQEKKADVNMMLQCGDYGSALAAAASRGQIEVVKFLVQEAGANVNMPLEIGDYGSAIAAASSEGHTETVDYLSQEGKSVEVV